MRKIELKKRGVTSYSGDKFVQNYRAELQAIVGMSGKGMNVEEIRKRVKVMDKLEDAKDVVELEDAEWELVKTLVSEAQFVRAEKHVLDFIDDILNAKKE